MKNWETEIIRTKEITENSPLLMEQLKPAVVALQNGELVAFPTETVYGLGANAFNPEAIRKIYKAKGRPQDNPLIVHLARIEDLEQVTEEIPPRAVKLFELFAPGPLTLVLKRHPKLPSVVSAGLDTVAIRIPAHPVAQALIRLANFPLVAPSANISGKPSPTEARHVLEDLSGAIPFIIDGGATQIGLESTVLDLTRDNVFLLRPGGISKEILEHALSEEVFLPESNNFEEPIKSPGMKYRHYAPSAEVVILEAPTQDALEALISRAQVTSQKIAFYLRSEWGEVLENNSSLVKITSFTESQPEINRKNYYFTYENGTVGAAHSLFTAFRYFDSLGIDKIFVEAEEEEGGGLAYMNRVKKAASKK